MSDRSYLMFTVRALLVLAWGAQSALGAQSVVGGNQMSETSIRREVGMPILEAFSPRDYEGHNQVWGIVQDRTGVLYAGNRDCVLSYDGVRWRRIEVEGGLFIQGVAIDEEDRVWVGGAGELGYLEPDGRGGRRFVSLRENLLEGPEAIRMFFDVVALPHGIYFIGTNGYVRWREGEVTHHRSERVMGFQMGNEFVLHERGQPLRAFDGERWRVVSDEAPTKNWITMVTPRADGRWLLGTLTDGFWLLDPASGRSERWATEVDARLRTNRISWGIGLRDGAVGISQRPNGMLIVGPDGRVQHSLDADNGLPGSLVSRFFQDRQGDVWLGLDRGIARLRWPADLTKFTHENGLGHGVVKAIKRHRGDLFVGTSEGLYRLVVPAAEKPLETARFALVKGLDQNVWSLDEAQEYLLVASSVGARRVDFRGDVEEIGPVRLVTTAHFVGRNPNHVLVGTSDSISIYERGAEGWQGRVLMDKISGEVRSIHEEVDGTIWIGVSTLGFYRVVGLANLIGDETGEFAVEHYPGGHGLASDRLPGLPTATMTSDGALRFLDAGGMYRFDASAKRFERILSLGAHLGVDGVKVPTLASGLDGSVWFRTLRSDRDGGLWQGRQIWKQDAHGEPSRLPFLVSELIGENPNFLEEPAAEGRGSVLWLGGVEGLVRAELPAAFAHAVNFRAVIRAVSDAEGNALPLAGERPSIEHAHRGLSLTVASDRVDDRQIRFETKIDDGAWSRPDASAEIVLPSLSVGAHRVSVRARDADGRRSEAATFEFYVLPPWWLTWWALAGYVVAGVGAMSALLRWRLRAAQKRNEELARQVESRTAELTAREAQLVEARDAANAANRSKSVFLASMSHELRTPLNAILGYAQILRRASGLDAESRRQLETVQASGNHLLTMINDVLDLAKIEAGKIELRPQAFSVARLLAHLTEVFEPRAAQKKIAFTLHGETALPEVVIADEGRLRQVLYNLLGNALKFTERGRVELHVGVADRRLGFVVTDSGIGIPVEVQGAIFGLFHQASTLHSAEGVGLGLAISQRLVSLMGGEITVKSKVGEGSRFAFSIPLHVADGLEPSPVVRTPTGYYGARRRVLIVDDDAVNRDVLRALLAPLGFVLSEADDGETALAQFEEFRPDLVLTDIRMRRLDGIAAIRRLRAMNGGRQVKVIAISASAYPMDRADALGAGCDEFEAKPVVAESLLKSIGRLLSLEWEFSPVARTASSIVPPAHLPNTWSLPSVALLRTLGEQIEMGDLVFLRNTLAEARAGEGVAREFIDALAWFAAHARLVSLRQWVEGAIIRASSNE